MPHVEHFSFIWDFQSPITIILTFLCKILTKSSSYVQTLIDRLCISDFESKIRCCMGVISLSSVETEPIGCPKHDGLKSA